jgi:hypothetical protein
LPLFVFVVPLTGNDERNRQMLPRNKKAAAKAAAFSTLKNKLKSLSQFSSPKNDSQRTTFTTQSTTTSPQKHHAQPITFTKNPCKTANLTTSNFFYQLP